MDLIRTLLVYMSLLLSSSAVSSPAMTPVPPSFSTPTPAVTATAQMTAAPTSLPTITPTATPTRTPLLAVGDRGEDVRRLQARLQELGYLGGKVDGIFGKQTKEALEEFQRLNRLSVDGIAGPKTYQKLFNDPNVVRAPIVTGTPRPVVASVPVYYRNNRGVLLGSDTVLISQGSLSITPNPRLIPANHTMISAASVAVTVDSRGRATPASVVFIYQPKSELVPVLVPIYYRTTGNETLATDSISVLPGESLTIVANASKVPAGYTLITSGRLSVSVSTQGVATPSALTFIYRKDAVSVNVTVNYRDTGSNLIGQEIKTLAAGTHTITANSGAVPPGYTLQGSNTQQVTVSESGTATPSSITFVYKTSQVTVTVPVKYLDQANSAVLYSDTVSIVSGQSAVITSNQSYVPEGYVLVGSGSVTVTVNAQGVPNPAEAIFIWRRLGQAQVAVQYKSTDGALLGAESFILTEGTHTITANDNGLAGWIRQGAATQTLTVNQNGTATPAEVVFLYERQVAPTATPTATPTAAPATATPTVSPALPIQYIIEYIKAEDETQVIGGYMEELNAGTHQLSARDTQLGDRVLVDTEPQTVTVGEDGTANPAKLIFRFAVPSVPVLPIQYIIEYVKAEDETQVIGGYMEELNAGTHQLSARDTQLGDRVLVDTEPQTVTVGEDGTANPAKLIFRFAVPSVPVLPIQYTIEYVNAEDETQVIGGYMEELNAGTHQLSARDTQLGDRVLVDTEPQTVTVGEDGTANPAKLIFRFAVPSVPVLPIQYTIEYVNAEDETQVIGGYMEELNAGTHQLSARDTQLGDRVLVDTEPQTVTVGEDGTANPAKLIFRFAVPSVPVLPIQYTIEYVNAEDETQVIGGYMEELNAGTHQLSARDTQLGDRVLVDTEPQTVTVGEDGTANPAKLIFRFELSFMQFPNMGGPILNEGSFPVYAGPGETYHSFESAAVPGGTEVFTYGTDSGWAIIAYGVNGGWRLGYVSIDALAYPGDLNTWSSAAMVTITDATLRSNHIDSNNTQDDILLPAGSPATVLAQVKDTALLYIETIIGETPVRGFIDKSALGL